MHKTTQVLSEKYVECARIFVDKTNRSNVRLRCLYCCKVCDCYHSFMAHLQSRHAFIPDEEPALDEADLYRLQEPELVLIAEDKCDAAVEYKEEIDIELVAVSEHESVLGVQPVVATPLAVQTNEAARDVGLSNVDNSSSGGDRHTAAKKRHTRRPMPSHAVRTKTTRTRSGNERVRVFYSFRDTNPDVIIDFIDMIECHPCHWNRDHQHEHRSIKENRHESAAQIARLLLERWNVVASAQETRNSILTLCRWFEREYMRTEYGYAAQPTQPYACVHPDYYQRLLSFLPTQHLQLLTCEACARRFKTEGSLRTHQHVAHAAEKPYQCPYCTSSFVHRSAYKQHENRHTKERIWPCDLCAYRGVSRTDLMLHMHTHTNVRNYVCSQCGAAYKSSTSLSVHKRTHAPPKLTCHICGRKFYENYRLKLHLEQRHKAPTLQQDVAQSTRHSDVAVHKTVGCSKLEELDDDTYEDLELLEEEEEFIDEHIEDHATNVSANETHLY